MARYLLELAYFGKAYSGWQIQPNAVTIQETVEKALSTIFNERIAIVGCGRTDAGVHARKYYAHFDSNSSLPDKLLSRLNKFLPADISVFQINKVTDEVHARFSASYRAYEYHCHFQKDPFKTDHSYFFTWVPLDIEAMKSAFDSMREYKDFRAFCKTGGEETHFLCDIFETKLSVDPKTKALTFRIAANRFLRGMVRRVVGTLLMVGKGKISVDEFRSILAEKKMFELNLSVPPQGLYLVEVRYQEGGHRSGPGISE